ncbi:amidase [Vagococcus acidifermentans]|uniref:Amidase n=1 Tax=Vagococcus acidifermentans TaxID=564710 RepID=A0A430AVT1_9ENTE|nr:amidase [Vagococcus acidifermentans]RSU12159.1 amidase [Vagococcus acidifermentans]
MEDATYFAELIKQRKITPSELIESFYNKARVYGELNAFTSLNLSEALAAADRLTSYDKPFSGVPIPLKNLGQNKRGWPATAGSKLLKDAAASQTDYFVQALERAGFIPFGQTNAPEFGFKNISDSRLYGVVRNPWDTACHAGGSSGGAAAAVAAGIIPLAAASDGGGSIRIPASFCGLVGLKPSRGNVVTGPGGYRGWQGASIDFVLGVSIRDAEKMLSLLRPTHQISPYGKPLPTVDSHKKHLKIAVCTESPVGSPVSESAKTAVKQAADFLASLGHDVDVIAYPVNGDALIRSYYTMNGGETASMMAGIEQALGRSVRLTDVEPMTWTIYQYGRRLSAAEYSRTFGCWDEAAAVMEQLFTTYDLFLSPTTADTAPKMTTDLQSDTLRQEMQTAEMRDKTELAELVYAMFEKSLQITPYTQLANLTGQPALSLPTYVTDTGMPLGVQLMSAKGNDQLLLEVGRHFEIHQKFKLPAVYRT